MQTNLDFQVITSLKNLVLTREASPCPRLKIGVHPKTGSPTKGFLVPLFFQLSKPAVATRAALVRSVDRLTAAQVRCVKLLADRGRASRVDRKIEPCILSIAALRNAQITLSINNSTPSFVRLRARYSRCRVKHEAFPERRYIDWSKET